MMFIPRRALCDKAVDGEVAGVGGIENGESLSNTTETESEVIIYAGSYETTGSRFSMES